MATLSPARRPAALLAALLAGLLLVSGCSFDGAYDLPLPGNAVDKSDGYLVTVEFRDALNVVPRTAVMVDDVVVGQVEEVERRGWHAEVQIRVRKDIDLPQNAVAEVRQTSLLGEKYIALLDPPEGTAVAARLSDGDTIPLSATGRNPEVEEVLGALSMLLSGGGVGQLKTISVELNKMLEGRTDNVRHVLAQIDALVGSLDRQKSNIISAMESIDHLAATLNREKKTFDDALDAMGPALEVLNEQHRALVTMLEQLDRLGAVGTRVIRGSKDDLLASLRHLRPVLTKLNEAGDSFPRGLSMLASFPFPKEAGDIARGDYANALFKVELDLNKILKAPSTQLPNLINVCSATPLAPVCKTLDDKVLSQLCLLFPDNYLCGGAGPLLPGLDGRSPLGAVTELFGPRTPAPTGRAGEGDRTADGSADGSDGPGSGLGGLLGGLS
ncbi:MAG TPA: MCE family protein [Marmoricola sp.]|jgi:phospholipid/cholesterol/gamma-HCH transport system substrate-binding protein|nr:MCE family protein [Marmoricola sp.]